MHIHKFTKVRLLTAFWLAVLSAGIAQACPVGIAYTNCVGCHGTGTGTYAYTAAFTAPTVLEPNSLGNSITFTLTGASAADAGFSARVIVGTNSNPGDFNPGTGSTPISATNVTHSTPNAGTVGDDFSWTFTYDAPATTGTVTLQAFGNPVNGNRNATSNNNDFCGGVGPTTGTTGDGNTGDVFPSDSHTITINAAPIITASGGNAPHTEQLATTVDSALSLTDAESNNMSSATITISANYSAASGDSLTLGSCPAGATCGGSGTQTITITGGSAVGNYQTAFRSVSFNTTSDTPSTTTRTVQFSVTDTFSRVRAATRNVTVATANDAPVISNVDNALSHTEGESAEFIDTTITVSDVDTNCNQSTVSITGNYAGAEDVLVYGDAIPAITLQSNVGGVLTLSGVSPCTDYATALEDVTYQNTSQDPSTALRTVSFQVRDTTSVMSNIDTTTITVAAISDAPVISNVGGTTNYAEDLSPGVIIDNDVAVSDADSTDCNSATVDLSTNYQSGQDILEYTDSPPAGISVGSFNAGSGTLTLSASPAVSCASFGTALQSVRYRNTSQAPNTVPTRTVDFQVLDSGNTPSVVASKQITVTSSNDAPIANNDTTTVDVNSSDNPLIVLTNDSDPDGDTFGLSWVNTTPPMGGTASFGGACPAGRICYTPPG